MRLLRACAVVAALAPAVLADVKFITPKAGSNVPVGTISVEWEDSGDSPSIDALKSYTLQLMLGGNGVNDAMGLITLATGASFSTGNKASGVLSPTVAGSTKNGYYFKMISVAIDGGTITNYSDRFTVTGMTAVTPEVYAKAAAGVDGTDGPETEDNIANAAPAAGAGVAAGAAEYTVPYALQTGLTKYAPMQSVPPTKITLKNFTPLYPTSSYKIATAALPVGTIATTITQSQTFSVAIQENTAAAQAGPTGDMAKYLARWKD